MAGWVTLLGFAGEADAAALEARMAAVKGPKLRRFAACGLAALAQAETGRLRFGGGRAAVLCRLQTVQMRLEAACRVAAFLPADPAHARCAAGDVAALLAAAAPALTAALAGPGAQLQWDVKLRWPAEPVLAARRAEIAQVLQGGGGRAALAEAVGGALARERAHREAGLRRGLAGVALAMAPCGAGDTETGLTVLVATDGEAALEAALGALPADIAADAEIDMRGPLPPLSFAAVRIDRAAPAEVADAWRQLALPDRVDAAVLQQHWRDTAFRLHPDRAAGDGGLMAQAGAAFRLIRDLLPAEGGDQAWSLPALQRHAACRMRLAAPALDAAP